MRSVPYICVCSLVPRPAWDADEHKLIIFGALTVQTVQTRNAALSQVVAALMHIGDVLALAPTTIGTSDVAKPFEDLAVDYYGQVGVKTLPTPKVCACDACV